VARLAAGDEPHGTRDLFGGADSYAANFAIARHRGSAFGQSVLGFDLAPVLVHQVVDTDARGGFFTSFGEEDHVTIELHVQALPQDHEHQGGGGVVLVVHRAARVDEAVLAGGSEGIESPFLLLDADYVGVAHH
jgi:hypothetical protein